MATTSDTGCCPRFNPEPWDEKEINFNDKYFIKDRVKSIFHIPINFSTVVKRNLALLEKSGAKNTDNIMLSDENSLWGADLYIATDKPVASADTEKVSGTFLAKAFEGPYSNAGKWAREINQFAISRGKKPSRILFWYTTCPKCAKAYGKNPVVALAQV